MRKLILIFLFPLLTKAQPKNEIINPKGKWYFGAEIGTNKISSLTLDEPNQSFQGGVLAEYYFARHWSLSGRINPSCRRYVKKNIKLGLKYVF